jgi:hypothetical protein
MIIAVGILIYSYIGMDNTNTVSETPTTQNSYQNSNSSNDQINERASDTKSASTAVTLHAENAASVSANTSSANTSSANTSSSYYKNNSSYQDTSSSYEQSNSNYGQNSSSAGSTDYSYSQNSSNSNSGSSSYSQNNSSNTDTGSASTQSNSTAVNSDSQASQDNSKSKNSDATEEQDSSSDEKTKAENQNAKFQRIYDNGIAWYGNTGSLVVEYQASNPQTTGIGFRVHYDSSSMRVTNVSQYPVDAITATSAASSQSDTRNYDENEATDNFLTFAWASIYGQWPQTNQVSLATIEFERVNGGSSNYNIAYSAISTSAGYQFTR